MARDATKRTVKRKDGTYGHAPFVKQTENGVVFDYVGLLRLKAAVDLAAMRLSEMNRSTAAGRRAGVRLIVRDVGHGNVVWLVPAKTTSTVH